MENGKILDNLGRIDRIKALIAFDRENELREELGWFEHTADWDPFLIIEVDGEDIETEAGYSNFDIVNYFKNKSIESDAEKIESIRVYVENLANDTEPLTRLIPIDKIKKILWAAH